MKQVIKTDKKGFKGLSFKTINYIKSLKAVKPTLLVFLLTKTIKILRNSLSYNNKKAFFKRFP
jgi:hypothetical protein